MTFSNDPTGPAPQGEQIHEISQEDKLQDWLNDLKDVEPTVRVAAAQSLAGRNDSAAALTGLIAALGDNSEDVVIAVAESLSNFRATDSLAIVPLYSTYHSHDNPAVQLSIVHALSDIDPSCSQFKSLIDRTTFGDGAYAANERVVAARLWTSQRLRELGDRAPQWAEYHLRRTLRATAKNLDEGKKEELAIATIEALVAVSADDDDTLTLLRALAGGRDMNPKSDSVSKSADTAARALANEAND